MVWEYRPYPDNVGIYGDINKKKNCIQKVILKQRTFPWKVDIKMLAKKNYSKVISKKVYIWEDMGRKKIVL